MFYVLVLAPTPDFEQRKKTLVDALRRAPLPTSIRREGEVMGLYRVEVISNKKLEELRSYLKTYGFYADDGDDTNNPSIRQRNLSELHGGGHDEFAQL